jgi:hypothetical protein
VFDDDGRRPSLTTLAPSPVAAPLNLSQSRMPIVDVDRLDEFSSTSIGSVPGGRGGTRLSGAVLASETDDDTCKPKQSIQFRGHQPKKSAKNSEIKVVE